MQQQRKLAAIMFTDIVGYTALMQQDEDKAVKIRERHREIFDTATKKFKGNILQYYGDGTLSTFDSAIDAVMCGIEMQLAYQQWPQIPVRIGIHLGDIIYSDVEVIGDGVNVASRIESLAVAGSVLISDKIYEEIENQRQIQTHSLGSFDLKNVNRPMEVYAINNEGLVVPRKDQIKGKIGEKKSDFSKISRKLLRRLILSTLLIIILAVAGYFIYNNLANVKSGEEIAYEKSIAVLPFVNMSGEPEQEYFSDGITEEILNALAQLDGLKVAGRTSSFAFKGENQDLKLIGKKLNVSTILEGSIQKSGDRLRITVQLINVSDGFHLWSERYDRKLDDIFAIQDDISARIAEKLKISYLQKQNDVSRNVPTKNMEAYELMLKGYYFFAQRSEGVGKALTYFQEAIELDPNYAAAYVALGNCYIFIASGHIQPSKLVIPMARAAVDKAISIDNTNANAHLLLARIHFFYDWDWEGAEKEYNKAIEFNLNSPDIFEAFYQASLYKNFDQAISIAEKVLERHPLNFSNFVDLAYFNLWDSRYNEARDVCDRILELNPMHSGAFWIIGESYLLEGNLELAIENFQKSANLSETRKWLAISLIPLIENMGQKEEVIKLLSKLETEDSSGSIPIIFMVNAYGSAGLYDESFKWLDRAFKERDYSMARLKINPYLKPIHTDPRWEKMLDRMGFPD